MIVMMFHFCLKYYNLMMNFPFMSLFSLTRLVP
jgi:hypothetical protein